MILFLLGESASPFIDEGDGLTSEKERVRSLLSLAAHTGGYEMMVGTHNTVECQMHVGGYVVFFRYGKYRYLLYHRCREACRGFYHVLPGTVNADAHNTVDALEAHGGSLSVFVWYGS